MTTTIQDFPTLDDIAAEEAELRFRRFTNDDAWALGTALVEEARRRSLAVAIDINRGGQQLFHAALEGTAPDNDEWIRRKVNTVLRFGCSSLYLSVRCRQEGKTLGELREVDVANYAAAGGSFPIHVTGVGIVGAVTVSGLPQVDDHRLVVDVLRGFLGDEEHRLGAQD